MRRASWATFVMQHLITVHLVLKFSIRAAVVYCLPPVSVRSYDHKIKWEHLNFLNHVQLFLD